MNRKRLFYVLIMVFIAAVYCSPIAVILFDSFKPKAEMDQNRFSFPGSLTFDNYFTAWIDMRFPEAAFNTVIITVTSTAGIVLFGSMAAYAMQRFGLRIGRILYLVLAFFMLIPFQAFMFPLVEVVRNLGLPVAARIIPVYWGLGCPFAAFIMYVFIKRMPIQWEEAAAIDGANPFVIFFKVVLPLLTPATMALAIANIFWIWNDFLLPLMLSAPTLQLTQYKFFTEFRSMSGHATASLVLTSLPIAAFYLMVQKYMTKRVITGALMG
jgi:raffinose/stachyose/melibiose transport system permease protein